MLRSEDPLTPRQREALQAVHRCLQQDGLAPTIDDLGSMLGVSSDQSVLELLSRLEKKGLVRRTAGRARSLRITEEGRRALGPEMVAPIPRAAEALSPSQQLIAARLAKINPKLRPMYEGGVRVLADVENPERFHQSAHSIRELTANLSRAAKDLLEPSQHKA